MGLEQNLAFRRAVMGRVTFQYGVIRVDRVVRFSQLQNYGGYAKSFGTFDQNGDCINGLLKTDYSMASREIGLEFMLKRFARKITSAKRAREKKGR